MAIYLEMFHTWADRFVTGTDFVSSYGSAEDYPGIGKRFFGILRLTRNGLFNPNSGGLLDVA